MKSIIYLYGPPGSGKTTTGKLLAAHLGMPFVDLDDAIVALAGRSIPEIFATEGEASFRKLEADCLQEMTRRAPGVVALGGGALLAEANRAAAERAGMVVCLMAHVDHLHARLVGLPGSRPLLGKAEETRTRLNGLLEQRAGHYASFPHCLDTSGLSPEQAAWQVQTDLGLFRISGMGEPYDVRVLPGGLAGIGAQLAERGLKGPVVLVSDTNVASLHANHALNSLRQAGFSATLAAIPAGEAHKTIATASRLWDAFLSAGLERSSTVVALGGGVVTDLSGFAAATYLRGVRWVALPSTLLAMADASLGGKTGADLPQGKNLVGAFHPPALVLADPDLLASLPEAELRNGLGEVVKHGILADPALFESCRAGWQALSGSWSGVVRRAMAVKIQYIQADPYEKGLRAALNLGHTLGHAVETASSFQLKHGEAVAVGLVGEARLAEHIGLAQAGLADTIAATLARLGLPVRIPDGIDRARLIPLMQVDKKKAGGSVRFALPVRIGEVETGINVTREDLEWMIAA